MEHRVDYLSDKLVHVRAEIKARQKEYLESIGRGKQSAAGEVSEASSSVAAASGASGAAEPARVEPVSRPPLSPEKEQALLRRYEQTLQLRRDLEQRMIRCEARLRSQLTAAEDCLRELSGRKQALDESAGALRELSMPEPGEVAMVELGELYRAIDRERVRFFQIEAEIDAAAPASESAAPPVPPFVSMRFAQALKLGLAFSLPLILGLGLAVLGGALLLFFSWR